MTWDISFDEICVSLDGCIIRLCHPINMNYVFEVLIPHFAFSSFIYIFHLISKTSGYTSSKSNPTTFIFARSNQKGKICSAMCKFFYLQKRHVGIPCNTTRSPHVVDNAWLQLHLVNSKSKKGITTSKNEDYWYGFTFG